MHCHEGRRKVLQFGRQIHEIYLHPLEVQSVQVPGTEIRRLERGGVMRMFFLLWPVDYMLNDWVQDSKHG